MFFLCLNCYKFFINYIHVFYMYTVGMVPIIPGCKCEVGKGIWFHRIHGLTGKIGVVFEMNLE